MSSPINPVSEATTPFVPEATPAMDRANRLISLRQHPGFLDVLRISQEIVQSAADQCADFPGWDPLQITILKVRMQVAKEHHQLLIGKINDAIHTGLAEAAALASSLPVKTPQEMLDQGDYVRQQVLKTFDGMESRSAGSY